MIIDPGIGEKKQIAAFNKLLVTVYKSNAFYQKKYSKFNLQDITGINSAKKIQKIPYTMKKDFEQSSKEYPPFGNNKCNNDDYVGVFCTSGTQGKQMVWPFTKKDLSTQILQVVNHWRSIGITKDDRIFISLNQGDNYISFEAAKIIGCLTFFWDDVFPLEKTIRYISENRITVLCISPIYAIDLAEQAKILDYKTADFSVKKVMTLCDVGGSILKIKIKIEKLWHAKCYDWIGSTEASGFAAECLQQNGPHLNTKDFLFEVIDPVTLHEGTKGELIITTLWNKTNPLIRYKSSDLVEIDTAPCKCGLTSPRLLGGILGRFDNMIKIGGYNFYPHTIENIINNTQGVDDYIVQLVSRNGLNCLDILLSVGKMFSEKTQKSLTNKIRIAINTIPALSCQVKIVPNDAFKRNKRIRKVKRFIDLRSDESGKFNFRTLKRYVGKLLKNHT